MTDLVKLMQAQYKKIILDFEFMFSAEQVSHSSERGRLLEETLRKFLVDHLPKRIGIGTGQIAEARGKSPSKQMDIVLYDPFNYPLLLNDSNYQMAERYSNVSIYEFT
jgi:hypothetical protein